MIRPVFGFSLLVASLAAFVYVETEAQAQALQLAKPFTGVVNKAVASTLGKRLNTLGFAVNDPIYGATLAAAETVVGGAVAAGSVAATVAAVGSAPVWLSVALGLGAAYEIYDFSVGRFDFKADSASPTTLQITTGTLNLAAPLPPPIDSEVNTNPNPMPLDYGDPGVGVHVAYPNDLKLCATVTATGMSGVVYCGNLISDIENQSAMLHREGVIRTYGNRSGTWQTITSNVVISSTGPTKTACTFSAINCPEGLRYAYNRNLTTSYIDIAGNPRTASTVYNFQVFNNPSFVEPAKQYTVNDAASKLVDSDLLQRADPELLAAIANKIWQLAAQDPAYNGAPYDAQNPITATDILGDVSAGLYPHPTNYDLLSRPSPSASTAPVLDPAASPVEAPASDSVTVDLGPDPGIAAPGLEDAPTGQSIVAHVMALLPSVSAFTLPAHTGECVMPSFDFFGHSMTMQGACDLVEAERALLSTLFTAIWGIAGLVTVLRA